MSLPPEMRDEALAKLGYSTPAHRDILGHG